jgi:hypothetical protein
MRSEGKPNYPVKLEYVFQAFEQIELAVRQLQQSLNDYRCKFLIEPKMKKAMKDKAKVPKLNLQNVLKPDFPTLSGEQPT